MISEITKNAAFPPCSHAAGKALVACAARKVSPTRRAKIISRFFSRVKGDSAKNFLTFFVLIVFYRSSP